MFNVFRQRWGLGWPTVYGGCWRVRLRGEYLWERALSGAVVPSFLHKLRALLQSSAAGLRLYGRRRAESADVEGVERRVVCEIAGEVCR